MTPESLILDAVTFATLQHQNKIHACVTLPGNPQPLSLDTPSPWQTTANALKPGAYCVSVVERSQAAAHTIAMRLAGLQIRDVVEIMASPSGGGGRGAAIIGRKALDGTVAENVSKHGTGGINVDGTRIGTQKRVPSSLSKGTESGHDPDVGRWPANVLLDVDAAAALDEQSGFTQSTAQPRKNAVRPRTHAKGAERSHVTTGFGDSGGASRFFASAPDVAAALRWFVRLVTPPGGIVVDPFAASSRVREAVAAEGFSFVGVTT